MGSAAKPRLSEALEGVPTHAFFFQSHLKKSGREPAVFEVVIQPRLQAMQLLMKLDGAVR